MGLIICLCGKQRNVKPVKRAKRRCSNCGAADPRIIRRLRWWTDTEDREGIERHEARRQTYAGLLWIRDQKGYKPKYAEVKFKAIYSERINGEAVAGPEPPTAELLAWIARDNARFKARKKAEEANKWKVVVDPCESAESPVDSEPWH